VTLLVDAEHFLICGSVWSMKFLGLPPPTMRQALFPPPRLDQDDRRGLVDVRAYVKRSWLPARACSATFIPIELSPGELV